MKIHDATHGQTNVTLTAKNCRQIAAALTAAAANTATLESDHLQDLGAAFHALAIAAYAQYELTPAAHACHLTDLVDTGLADLSGFPKPSRSQGAPHVQ
jgi:hypothetical protein